VEQIMRGFRFVLPVVASVFVAGTAQAAPTVSAVFNSIPAYEAALLGLGLNPGADRQAVSIARVGNNVATPTQFNGAWEAAVFVPNVDPGTFLNGQGTPGNFVWPSSSVSMTLTRVGANMTFTVGGYSQSFTLGNVGLVDTLGLQLASQAPGANNTAPGNNSATWSNLTLTSLAGGIATQTAANGADLYQIVSGIGAGDFTLGGTITLAFDPLSRPGSSQLGFRIAAYATALGTGNVTGVPVPAAVALFGVGLLALAGLSARLRA
jgi:hypothetical protein